MERHPFTTKRMFAIGAVAAIIIAVAFLAPPIARVAIALVALPLTAMLAAAIAGGPDRSLPQS